MISINLKQVINTYIIPITVAIFNVIIILFPTIVLDGAKNGLLLWFNKVLPSLLPFFIGTSMMTALGICDFLGVLFAPMMNFFFKLSGESAYAYIVGLISGYPVGAKITCDLYSTNRLTKNEAQRLLGFSNNSGPLFILATVGTSFLGSVKLGYLLLLLHFLSSFLLGIIISIFDDKTKIRKKKLNHPLQSAFLALSLSRKASKKSLGEILANSIKTSVETILQIGGFIILFSVISTVLNHFLDNLNPSCYIKGALIGIIEITNGCALLSSTPTEFSIIIISALLSWGGLSIHAQTLSVIIKTDLNTSLYILSKFTQSLLALLLSILALPVIRANLPITQTTFAQFSSPLPILKLSTLAFCLSTILLILAPAFIIILKSKLSNIFKLKNY